MTPEQVVSVAEKYRSFLVGECEYVHSPECCDTAGVYGYCRDDSCDPHLLHVLEDVIRLIRDPHSGTVRMVPDQVMHILGDYRQCLRSERIIAKEHPHDRFMESGLVAAKQHCGSMFDDIFRFFEDGRADKAFRWFGFIQGVLWVAGMYTLDDLVKHREGHTVSPPDPHTSGKPSPHCFTQADRINEAFCLLCFVQGVLWVTGVFTLNDLKDDNRPTTV